MDERNLIKELYKSEYSKMVSVLCNKLGIAHMETAADIVSDTFLTAAETWGQKGVPPNPAAWLYTVAKNNAINSLRHSRTFEKQIKNNISREAGSFELDIDLSPQNITDSQLQMMFAVCHPLISQEAQISLALRILCGFTIDEIACALLTTKSNINKRLFRAKEKLRTGNIKLSFPGKNELGNRLNTVLVTLYLLFNEGYYSAHPDKILRKDFCLEAMRLAYLLTENEQTRKPGIYALLALMCYQASRFDARLSQSGNMILYEDQDSNLWDTALINRGNYFFVQATASKEITRYHIEAAIAWWHTHQADADEKWQNILQLYNKLLIMEYSPVAALNRAYVFSKVHGKEKAIAEAESLQLSGNLFYHSLLGTLYSGINNESAAQHLKKAIALAGTPQERSVLVAKLSALAHSAEQSDIANG